MSDTDIKQRVSRYGFFSPEMRGAYLIGFLVLITLCAAGVAAYMYLKPDDSVKVTTGRLDASAVQVSADAETSEAYREAKRLENEERYEKAKSTEGGVAIPFTFDEEPIGGEEGTDIDNCGCTISDEQLIAAIRRLGITDKDSSPRDNMRVSNSDIYVSINGQLMGQDGVGLLFRGSPIFMQEAGQLLDEKGISLLSKDKEPLYLGKNGEIIDRQTRRVPMHGDLQMSKGEIIIADGRLATRPGNMQRIARSDLYITKEGQIVTMDGKPTRHSGAFVYQNDERKLLNRSGMDVGWEQQAVYQNNAGHLVNVSGKKFKQPGILFSYEGILIDNDGLLTRPLVNLEKIANSDIFKTKSGALVDGYGLPVTHYGSKVRIGPGRKLLTTSGQIVKNRNEADVYLTEQGSLRVDVGKGSTQSGLLKISDGVALDRHGQMITRRGRLERRGTSDIYITSDGLLSDDTGKPVKFNDKDTFIDFSLIRDDGSQGLETYDHNKVTDRAGNRVYLTLDGRITDSTGNSIKDVGILTSYEGVLLTSSGKKVIQENIRERVVTKDGQPVTFQGKGVYKGEEGRLYDSNGDPILSRDGRAIYIDDKGNLVDENGQIVDEIDLMAGERSVVNGELSTRRKVTTSTGEQVFYDGKEVFIDSTGRLVDGSGVGITTNDGKEIYVDSNGNLIDESGSKISSEILTTDMGEIVNSPLIVGREQVVTKDGKSVKFNGKDVYRGDDGALYDQDGNSVKASNGERLYIDDEGNLVNKDGQVIDEDILTVAENRFVKSGDLITRKQLIGSDGNNVRYGSKDVFISDNGKLVDEKGNSIKTGDGKEIFLNEDGTLTDIDGNPVNNDILNTNKSRYLTNSGGIQSLRKMLSKSGNPLSVNGKQVYVTENGNIVDEDGNEVLTSDGRSLLLDGNGNIIDTNGNILTEDIFEEITERNISPGEITSVHLLTDEEGNSVLHEGKEVFRGLDGILLDSNGKPVTTSNGRNIFVDNNGDLVDENGALIDENILKTVSGENISSGLRNGPEKLTTKDGASIKFQGSDVYKSSDGSLIDKFGNQILTREGKKIFVNDDGSLIDSDGRPVDDDIVTVEEVSFVKDDVKIGNEKLVTSGGQKIKYKNDDVFKSADGSLVDRKGNAILTSEGKKIYVNDSGVLVDSSGTKVVEDIFTIGDSTPLVNSGGINSVNKAISKDGSQLKYKGKNVFIDNEGRVVDDEGKLIKTKDGRAIFIDKDGNIRDKEGNIVDEDILEKINKRKFIQGDASSRYEVTDSNGNQVFHDGRAVFTDHEGRIIDQDGNVILSKDGLEIFKNAEGNLVDKSGNLIEEEILTDYSGKRISSGLKQGREKLTTKSGENVTYQDRDVYKSSDGSLIDGHGKPILSSSGKKLFVDNSGQIIDEDGKVQPSDKFIVKSKTFVKDGINRGAQKLVSKNGKNIRFKGEDVYRDNEGYLVDSKGAQIYTNDGKRIRVDKNGRLIDESGEVIDDPRFHVSSTNGLSGKLLPGQEQLTTLDGKPVKYKGLNVFKNDDGSLFDSNGNKVQTSDGRTVYMDNQGRLVDENGNIVTEDLLSAESKPINANNLTTVPSSEMKKIASSDLFVTRDGSLLDKEGRAITYNGKNVHVAENGQIFDSEGNPVTDKEGRSVFLSPKGELIDRNGNLINDSLLADGDGVLVGSDGKSVSNAIKRVGDSDIYQTADGRLVDHEGRVIKHNGRSVYTGDDGRLYYENGRPVTDSRGKSVYLDATTGSLLDRNGTPIQGNILTSETGTLIDNKGELITSGGKLTKISGTDLYRTEDGQIVNSDGQLVRVNSKPVYTDESGKIVDKYGRAIRYRGQEIYISEDGEIVDRNGQPIVDENKRSVTLADDGGLVNEDGESIDIRTGKSTSSVRSNAGFKKTVEASDTNVRSPASKGNKSIDTNATTKESNETYYADDTVVQNPNRNEPSTASSQNTNSQGSGNHDVPIQLDEASAQRLQRRYAVVKTAMRNRLNKVKSHISRDVQSEYVSIGGTANSGIDEDTEENSNDGALNSDGGEGTGSNQEVVYEKAGRMLYALTDYQVNSDFSTEVAVSIVGLPYDHPLYNATAMGTSELVYDHMVLTFNKMCPIKGDCVPMKGVALDPATARPALASDVDHHYWYRYGGLFLSSLLEGASEAAGESGTREESTSSTGTRVTTTGLEGDKLFIRSLGKVGERFADAFSDNVNRPSTAWINPGEEMAIMLFDDIKGSAN
ncbi:hypothetical protein [Microbulbifer epialgicus]|uniref:Uncharacterized protein n=1 Tax=Microbulbifer epialgicus TaxID=393907 RepID=A0ABV4NUH7_9GAMM